MPTPCPSTAATQHICPSPAQAAAGLPPHPLLAMGWESLPPEILLSPAWTRAAPATSSWDVEDVPRDGTLSTDWAPVPPRSSPRLPASTWLLACWPGWVLPCLPLPVRLRTSAQHWPFCLFWLPSMGNVLFSGRISSAHISQTHPSSQRRAAEEGRSRGAVGSPWPGACPVVPNVAPVYL